MPRPELFARSEIELLRPQNGNEHEPDRQVSNL